MVLTHCSYDSRSTGADNRHHSSGYGASAYGLSGSAGGGPASAERPDLWSEPTAFGDRAHFRVSTHPAVLR